MFSSQNCALEQTCKPSSADSEPCSLQILSQFERFYQGRITEIEANAKITDTQRNEFKLKIMSDWIRDLGEQNTMLVRIVHDLEQATVDRVKLLENKLQETSNLISHNIINSDKPEEDLNALSGRLCELVQEQDSMKTKIDFLHKDIDSLLEFIKRGRIENNWNLDGITFFAIQPSDIPAPEECTCGQDSIESQEALVEEIAQKHDAMLVLKNKIQLLEDELQDSKESMAFKDEIIQQLKCELKASNNKKGPNSIRKVRMTTEPCQKFEDKTMEDTSQITIKQLEELKSLIAAKDNEITELKAVCNKHCNVETTNMRASFFSSNERQSELILFLTNLATSMEKDKKIILNLQLEYETVLSHLKQTKSMYENDVALAYEKLEDIAHCIRDYRDKVIDEGRNFSGIADVLTVIGNKVDFIQKVFQNKCEMCAKENVLSKIDDIISNVISGTQTLLKLKGKKELITLSIDNMIEKSHSIRHENDISDREQQEAFAAMLQQFRIMEEFRICTVEVQAATEDLREEMAAVISNLNSRHCKYSDFTQTIFQIQDYFTRTKENICDVLNRLELQDEEKNRHNERISNSRIRLKDLKNEFNQYQSELSKHLNDECINNPKNSIVDYMKIHKCNNLLISVTDEVEQLVSNLHVLQSQEYCTVSTMSELKKQLSVMEHNIKELKKKSDQILLDNETAQNAFATRLEQLEKYECEVDNCHTKMQDALESIVTIRDQMNEFGCIRDYVDTSQSTHDTIKVKEDLRKLQKKYEELKCKVNKIPYSEQQDPEHVDQRNCIIDLQDQINILQNEIKCKQETNIFLRQSIMLLEKELESTRVKFGEYRKSSTLESAELRKRIFHLENSLKVQSDGMRNNGRLLNNETDFNKSQQLLDNLNADKSHESTLKHGLQNVPQLFKVLQDTIQVINSNLREVEDKLKRLILHNSPYTNSSNDSLKVALELLTKHAESISYCSFEVEKIKAALYSKDKLMENMDEIIRIQKDSIMISQSEVENLHTTLQDKINIQEKMISEYETEKRHLYKQVDLQMQTIGHLQNAVVEAKRTIDQLTNNNSHHSRVIKSLSIFLTETQSQYNQCFREEELKNQTQHFIGMKNKIGKLELEICNYQYQCTTLARGSQEAKKEVDTLRCDLEESRTKSLSEKQRQIDTLSSENVDLKKQLNTYKLDFDLIEQEMKKMGVLNSSIEKFKAKLLLLRSENMQYRVDVERYSKTIDDMKRNNDILKHKLFELRLNRDNHSEKCKERILQLQNEICIQQEKIRRLNTKLSCGETVISKQVQVIENLKSRLSYNEHHIENCCSDLHFSKETIYDLRAHIDSLKVTLTDKFDCITKLKGENQIMKNENKILRTELDYVNHELCQTKRQLHDTKRNYEKISQDLNKYLQNCEKRFAAVQQNLANESSNSGQEGMKSNDIEKKMASLDEKLASKAAALAELQSKFCALTSKHESSERSCQRQKDEMMLLEKKLQVLQQKFQNCTEKNEDLLRQNKLLEDHNNKCMAELEDIVLQLEDMQSSLVDLRTECDAKAQSLDTVSVELERMKASKSEVCEESKYVLEWVRVWMRQQKQTTTVLQNKLHEKQQQLLNLSIDKKKFTTSMRRLKRANKILTKRLKLIHKPTCRQAESMARIPLQKTTPRNNSARSKQRQSKAVCSHFKRKRPEEQYCTMDKIVNQGDYNYFPALDHLIRQIPRSSQINGDIGIAKMVVRNDMADGGYQTSCSK